MPSALQLAIEHGHLQAVHHALDKGADLEAADMHGDPGLPLRLACFRGHRAIVLALLNRGANIDAPNAQGLGGPLRMAIRGNHPDIVHLLIERGARIPADVKLPTNDGHDRRTRGDRRRRHAGPPTGFKERRQQSERRTTSVEELELDEWQWDSLFSHSHATALQPQTPEAHDPASDILARVRD